MTSIPNNNNKDKRQQNGPIKTVKNEGGIVWGSTDVLNVPLDESHIKGPRDCEHLYSN